jgi:hypothetical protein
MPIAEAVKEEIELDAHWECPICAKNPPFNARVIAAMEECQAMDEGRIPQQNFNTLEEMWEDLNKEDA